VATDRGKGMGLGFDCMEWPQTEGTVLALDLTVCGVATDRRNGMGLGFGCVWSGHRQRERNGTGFGYRRFNILCPYILCFIYIYIYIYIYIHA
jgi:hypothetical protein